VFITAVPIIKLFAWGEGDSGGHVLRETTSRGLCGLVCLSRTSESRLGIEKCPIQQSVVLLLLLLLLLLFTAVPNTKLCAWGEEDSGGHVL
jgi:hypothetical protein